MNSTGFMSGDKIISGTLHGCQPEIVASGFGDCPGYRRPIPIFRTDSDVGRLAAGCPIMRISDIQCNHPIVIHSPKRNYSALIFAEILRLCVCIIDCNNSKNNWKNLYFHVIRKIKNAPQLPVTRLLKNKKRRPIAIIFRLNYLIIKRLTTNTPPR